MRTRCALASRCDRPSTTACCVVSGPASVSGGCNENHGTFKDVKTAMRYQHPEIEIVRTALNQGTGSVAVTKPCSHTPCAGSFVAAIQFPRAYRLEGGKERSEHWCTRQCETPEIPPRFVTGRGQVESFAIGVSGPVVEEGAEER